MHPADHLRDLRGVSVHEQCHDLHERRQRATDFARALWENPETYARATANYPLKRIGEPEEVAGAAVFLAAKAGSFVTGQTLLIDGGSTISAGDI